MFLESHNPGGGGFLTPVRTNVPKVRLEPNLRGRDIPVPSRNCAEHLRRKLAQQVTDTGVDRLGGHVPGRGACITGRTSIAMLSGAPPGPGADDAFAATS